MRRTTASLAVESTGSGRREELLSSVRAMARKPRRGQRTAVVIDDNEPNRELARALLERRGWHVLLADGGAAGLALARAERPALIVCDSAMPDVDGLSVARALKSAAATAGIPLLALTALAMHGDEERANAAGFDAYLTKPFVRDELDDTLSALFGGSPPPDHGG